MNAQPLAGLLEELDSVKSKVKALPEHIPGRLIPVKLDNLPLYLDVNGLKPNGLSATGALLVKKDEQK